jgi:hypothetical protein
MVESDSNKIVHHLVDAIINRYTVAINGIINKLLLQNMVGTLI